MNIVLGRKVVESLGTKYTVLSLDQFSIPGETSPVQAYCVLEDIPLDEMAEIEQWKLLHENLIQNYAKRNWQFCTQALEHLKGRWNHQLDSFYQNLDSRITDLQNQVLPDDWSPVINRSDEDR